MNLILFPSNRPLKKTALKTFACLFSIYVLFMLVTPFSLAVETDSAVETLEVKKLEDLTKAKIAEKKEEIEAVSEEIEKASEEKKAIAEEAKLKERKALLVQQEADLLMAEASKTQDVNILKKAADAEEKAKKIAGEASTAKEKLKIAEAREALVQVQIDQDQKEIEALRKKLYEIKLESAGLGGVAKWVNSPLFYIGGTPVTFGGLGSALVIVFASLLLSAFIQKIIIGKLAKTSRLKSGAVYAIGRVVHYLILILAAVIAAQCIGINLGSLAVVFGFLSVGIGFGLQNITSNFISGLILLFERPIALGDFVTVDGERGTVKQINMRSSLIETLDNVRIIVPNSKFIEGNVTNWTHGSTRVRIHCPVGVAYGSDVPNVKEALLKVATENEHVLPSPAAAVRFLGFGDSSLDFELLIWVDTPEDQYAIHSEINYSIDAAFREADIQIPFPQRDLHIKTSDVKF